MTSVLLGSEALLPQTVPLATQPFGLHAAVWMIALGDEVVTHDV